MPRIRAVLLAWLAVSLWSNSLYLRAALDPPAGRVFAGTFHWIDDFYNYAQYVQQAEDGHLLLHSKLVAPQDARPELLNLEWLLVGRISLALSRRPLLAYRVLGLIAALALVTGVERWLARLGVPPSHRLAALGLALFGGGLGGLLFETTDLTARQCLDLSVAIFPFLGLLANPHFTLGAALFVWALYCFAEVRAPGGPVAGIALGTVLGLVRPYDLALLGLVRGCAVVASERPATWFRSLVPLSGLLPVLAYDLWVFFGSTQFAVFRRGSPVPAPLEFVPALGPPLLLALLAWRVRDRESRRARVHLWVWAAVAAGLVLARPPAFSLQLLAGSGLPLLLLAATGMRRFAPSWTALVALCMSTSAVVATRIVLTEDPNWFVPRERLAAARALREACGPSDRLLSPPDIGLYAIGLTACHAFVSHSSAPDYSAHLAETRDFYLTMSVAARAAMLERNQITHLVLPGFAGPRPVAWLGPATTFQAIATVGEGRSLLSLYARGDRHPDPRSKQVSSRLHE